MLIVFRSSDGGVISLSGFRDMAAVPREAVDSICLADPLPEGQAKYRIYDPALMNAVWEAHDRGATLTVVLDDGGQPVGIKADGVLILPKATPS